MIRYALTRKPGKNYSDGLTTQTREERNFELLLEQHEAYCRVLESLGIELITLEPEPAYPDAYFVEDTAVVTRDVAVITNPGADTRRGETATIEPVLARYRKTFRIHPPGILDGGDVLLLGSHAAIGISERTNEHGARQLGWILATYGYTWSTVPVSDGLHLKSSVNVVGANTLLVSKAFERAEPLEAYRKIVVVEEEAYACNTLFLNGYLIMPAGYPETKRVLEETGSPVVELDVSEVRKMDGGLTCLSIRF
jgi:dimethylargininase